MNRDNEIQAAGVLLCAGSGSRMGGKNKLLRPILGKNSVQRSLEKMLLCQPIDRVVLVLTQDEEMDRAAKEVVHALDAADRCLMIKGGETRGDSVWHGLKALADCPPALVAIHDAARPLFSTNTLIHCLESAASFGSGIPGKPVTDTLRRTDKAGNGVEEVDRTDVWRVETPQCFRFKEIFEAYAQRRTGEENLPDDGAVYAIWGGSPHMVLSSEENMKITLPGDCDRAELHLRMLGEGERGMRIGLGEDRHRLVPRRKLVLGGIEIPYHMGLDGHSDADALCHALTDALLGALCLGDIGRHFPDDDPQYAGADSLALLKRAYDMVRQKGGRLINADAVITAESPKLAPFVSRIQENVERALELPEGCISVKAKTAEGMGPEGRGECISVSAVAMVETKTGEARDYRA